MTITSRKNLILIFVIAVTVGGIWYFETNRVKRSDGEVVNLAQDKDASLKKALLYPSAKEITTPDGFINTEPFKLEDLIGKKVILVDFMTYSCINCQRTFPYMNAWYEKYKDKGLEIVGIHTPEFEFEKRIENVEPAMKKFGIMFPIVLDNDFSTWSAYENRYWPHKYLIDIDGYIVYDHVGEGNYEETEKEIQKLLAERATRLGETVDLKADAITKTDTSAMPETGSPETYFGALRNSYLANGKQATLGTATFTLPATFQANSLYLGGSWDMQTEFAENKSSKAKIGYRFNSKKVFFVAESPAGANLTIKVDGKPIDAAHAGADVNLQNGMSTVHVGESRLYELFKSDEIGEHLLEIEVEGPGLRAYTFTFG